MKRYLTVLFLLLVSLGFAQEKRLALVVGNAEYLGKGNSLANPAHDATDISAKLKTLGFDVTTLIDGSLLQMDDAIDAFGRKAKNYDVALFYYSGHGIQSKGENYLVPVDAELRSEADVKYKCNAVNHLLAKLEESGCPMKVIVLDACRNNPFERSWHRAAGSTGLSFINAPKGTLISYATSPGSTADDGRGRNSPYTTAFLQTLDEPNLSLLNFFNEVGTKVQSTTNEEQIPWVTSSALKGSFYFNKKASPAPAVVQTPTPQKPSTTQPQPETVSTPVNANSHDYVDLGLPSGTLWATCNVGASKPEEYGDYFAWGETCTKSTYDLSTYKYYANEFYELTKYCNKSTYGNNDFTDNLTTLQSGDDPATSNWGNGWQTPSKAQWEELLTNTTNQWTTKNGVKGRLFTSKKNGYTLFLPAAGNRNGGGLSDVGSYGYYWSSTLNADTPFCAWYFGFRSGNYGMYRNILRLCGHSVRPVRSAR